MARISSLLIVVIGPAIAPLRALICTPSHPAST